jgi:putative SOS response-associated peptidase YedK
VCGRFTLKTPLGKWLFSLFGEEFAVELPIIEPRYNIAPTQPILIAKRSSPGKSIQLELARWGLVPNWSKEVRSSAPLINARSETISTKPSFRDAFKNGRCVVIADGYYEWQALDKKRKQAFWIHRNDESPFLMAAVATTNRVIDPDRRLQTVAVVTTVSNERLSNIHDRMPVVLDRVERVQHWLDSNSPVDFLDAERGGPAGAPNDFFQARPVSSRVGNPKNEDLRCLDPAPTLWQRTLSFDESVEPDV